LPCSRLTNWVRKYNRILRRGGCGEIPIAILKRLARGGNCKVSVGEGVVIPVNQTLATETMELLDELDEQKIELDVEDAKSVKVNLYYGS
jgi:protein-L-isoaspartate O-methyltransferase